jgi:hypothetical protein
MRVEFYRLSKAVMCIATMNTSSATSKNSILASFFGGLIIEVAQAHFDGKLTLAQIGGIVNNI